MKGVGGVSWTQVFCFVERPYCILFGDGAVALWSRIQLNWGQSMSWLSGSHDCAGETATKCAAKVRL